MQSLASSQAKLSSEGVFPACSLGTHLQRPSLPTHVSFSAVQREAPHAIVPFTGGTNAAGVLAIARAQQRFLGPDEVSS